MSMIKITCVTNDTIRDESNADFAIEQEYVISQFPHVEPFEKLDTGKIILPEKWEQLAADDIDWIVLSGPTPSKVGSSPDVTGPDGDHTSGDGNYVYIEASNPNNPGKKAEFITPKFDITSLANPELTFWCHMFSDSNHMGDLYLDIYVDGTWKNEVSHLTDNHDDAWFEVTQSLSEYVGSRVIFRFRGITGESWASDICIDDFKVAKAENTPVTPILQVPSQFTVKCSGSRIHYQIPEGVDKTTVSLALYNIQGKLVMEQKKKHIGSGYYTIDLRDKLAAGMYICRMHTEHFTKSISIVLAD